MSFDYKQPGTKKIILECENALKESLGVLNIPEALKDQWIQSNGFEGDNVQFYSTSEIIERNETLESKEYSPGFFIIANDGGSRVAMMKAIESETIIYLNYMGDMSLESMENSGMTLKVWIKNGCLFDLEEELEFSADESVSLRLDKMPNGGMKDVLKIKKILALNISIGELKTMTNNLPQNLCTVSYIGGLMKSNEINNISDCVSLWSKEYPSKKMPLDYKF